MCLCDMTTSNQFENGYKKRTKRYFGKISMAYNCFHAFDEIQRLSFSCLVLEYHGGNSCVMGWGDAGSEMVGASGSVGNPTNDEDGRPARAAFAKPTSTGLY